MENSSNPGWNLPRTGTRKSIAQKIMVEDWRKQISGLLMKQESF
jgi:hypothetical protein